MLKILFALAACVLGQAPQPPGDDARARALAPFVDPDVLAVVQLDLARLDVGRWRPAWPAIGRPASVAERVRLLSAWSEGLKQAGAREVFVVVSLDDLPGPPVVVVPLSPGSDAARIGRLLCGRGDPSSPPMFPTCATIHDAVVAGTPQAIERVRDLKPARSPRAGRRLRRGGGRDDRPADRPHPLARDPARLRGGRPRAAPRARRRTDHRPDPRRPLGGRRPRCVPAFDAPGHRLAECAGRRNPPASGACLHGPAREVAMGGRRRPPRLPAPYARSIGDRIRVTADADVAMGLASSIVEPVQESAIRSVCINNEKQITLALHNYHSSHTNLFPPAYSTGPDGKPLLSWRVLILPYLEQGSLYKEFHLDEPWDSPHNRALIARMPEVYRCPMESAAAAREGKTRYVAPRPEYLPPRRPAGIGIKEITDGTSNTIAFIDGGDDRAVTWTRPDDWDVSPAATDPFRGIFERIAPRRRKGTTAPWPTARCGSTRTRSSRRRSGPC